MPDATPIFTTRDPATGAVLFNFSGHVHAEGLDLSSGPVAAFTDVQAVEWTDSLGDNSLAAVIAAFTATVDGARGMQMVALPHGVTLATGLNNATGSGFTLQTAPTIGRVTARAGKSGTITASRARTIVDDLAQSDFVQTNTTRRLKLNGGSSQMFFGGVNSSTANIAHGLTDAAGNGVNPIAAFCIGAGFNFMGSIQGWDATNVNYGFQIVNPPGGTFGPGNMTFYWLAIG